jgi:hypothetical protein
MSTLTVTNIKATGETASRAVSGVAAAWVNFNGTGTVAIRDSNGNVSGLVDNGAGDYTANLTNSMANDDFMVPYSRGDIVSDVAGNEVFGLRGLAVGSVRVQIKNTSGVLTDNNIVTLAALGDLA